MGRIPGFLGLLYPCCQKHSCWGNREHSDLGTHLWSVDAYSLEIQERQRYAVVSLPGSTQVGCIPACFCCHPYRTTTSLLPSCSVGKMATSCFHNILPNSWCLPWAVDRSLQQALKPFSGWHCSAGRHRRSDEQVCKPDRRQHWLFLSLCDTSCWAACIHKCSSCVHAPSSMLHGLCCTSGVLPLQLGSAVSSQCSVSLGCSTSCCHLSASFIPPSNVCFAGSNVCWSMFSKCAEQVQERVAIPQKHTACGLVFNRGIALDLLRSLWSAGQAKLPEFRAPCGSAIALNHLALGCKR